MNVNDDFSQRVVVHAANEPWVDSPIPGVRRRMLDRIGDEVARATTIVEYAPDSEFSPHVHTGGEEFVVLEGVFSDEHGDFPAGSYIRNPPQSKHQPGSKGGCVIFVKLWQFDPNDRTHVRLQYDKMGRIADPTRPGIGITPLYQDEREMVQIEEWAAGTRARLECPDGAEVLVLNGELQDSDDTLQAMSWLRIPPGGELNGVAGDQGAKLWIKQHHLRDVTGPNTTS